MFVFLLFQYGDACGCTNVSISNITQTYMKTPQTSVTCQTSLRICKYHITKILNIK